MEITKVSEEPTKILKAPEKIIFCLPKIRFVVIGAGGTGSYLIRDLSRLVSIYNRKGRQDSILLIDGDSVEEHNLTRQNFISRDIGRNKAQVLATRYGSSFGIEISFIPEYLKKENFNNILNDLRINTVFIGCVDNNATRCIIHDMYRSSSYLDSLAYLDSGNEENAGQVVFSCSGGYTDNNRKIRFRAPDPEIPDAVSLFNMSPDDRHPEDLSCAERAVHAPQNIATNMMAAQVLLNYCNTIIASSIHKAEIDNNSNPVNRYMKYKLIRGISSHVKYFNSRTNTITSQNFPENISLFIGNLKEKEDARMKRYL